MESCYSPICVFQVVHVGFVCAGYKSTRGAVTLFKSLLFYRKNPLHFHFVSDNVATLVLKTMFDTWHIPALTVSFYAVEALRVFYYNLYTLLVRETDYLSENII